MEPNPKSVKLVVPKGINDVYIALRHNGKRSVTILVTISASGEYFSPYIVYPYERLPASIRNSMPKGKSYSELQTSIADSK